MIFKDQSRIPVKKWKMCEIYASNRKDGFTYQAYVREDDPRIVKKEEVQEIKAIASEFDQALLSNRSLGR